MSFKVYNGIKFSFKTLEEGLEVLKKFRIEILNAAQIEEIKEDSDYLIRKFDEYSITPSSESFDFTKLLYDRYQNKLKEKNSSYKSLLDYSAEVTLIPTSNYIIGLYYIQNKKLIDLFLKQRWVTDYHYQDQSDRDKKVSAREWNRRKNDWDRYLGYQAPAEVGYSFSLTQFSNIFTTIDNVVEHKISINKRLERLIKDDLINQEIKRVVEERKIDFINNTSIGFRVLREFPETDQYKKLYKERSEQISKLLIKNPKRHHFIKPS